MEYIREPEKIRTRIEAKFRIDPDGCWIWTGACNSAGYGIIRVGDEVVTAYKAAQFVYVKQGTPSYGYTQTCQGPRRCVNPEHWRRLDYEHQVSVRRAKASKSQSAYWATQPKAARQERALAYWEKRAEVAEARRERGY